MFYYQNFIIYKTSECIFDTLIGLGRAINMSKENKCFLIIDIKNYIFSDYFEIVDKELRYEDNYDVIPPEFNYCGKSVQEIKNENIIKNKNGYSIFGNIISKKIDEKQVIQFVTGSNGKNNEVFISGLKVLSCVIDRLNNEPKMDAQYISVHFMDNIKKKVNKIREMVRRTGIRNVYLATDDYNSIENFRRLLPNINFVMNKSENEKGIYEYLRDMYFILHSDYFIPSYKSYISRMIVEMIEKKNNLFNLQSKTSL